MLRFKNNTASRCECHCPSFLSFLSETDLPFIFVINCILEFSRDYNGDFSHFVKYTSLSVTLNCLKVWNLDKWENSWILFCMSIATAV